jgi:transcriptional regulator with XRE-family HTH domain
VGSKDRKQSESQPIGRRIAAYRRRRGLSQAAVAGLIGRSESWLSQVERGIHSIDKLSVLLDLAKVLDVDAEQLTGRTWELAPNGGAIAGGLTEIRQVFTRYDHLLGVEPPRSPSLPELRTQIATVHRAYQAARYDETIALLPDLLLNVEEVPRRVMNGERRESLLSYVSAYVVAAKLATKLGVVDLATLAADRAANIAVESESETARAMAAYQVTCALLRADRGKEAELVAIRMAESLEGSVRSDDPTLVSVVGALWLIGAVAAARRTDRWEAEDRLECASRLADLLGEDGNHFWTAFGPTNVAIHRVSVAAELGDPAAALEAALAVSHDRLPTGLKSRRAQVNLDLAWAQSQRRRDPEATFSLLEAERIAPEVIRHNIIAQGVVREMLARGRGNHTVALAGLARRAGLLH